MKPMTWLILGALLIVPAVCWITPDGWPDWFRVCCVLTALGFWGWCVHWLTVDDVEWVKPKRSPFRDRPWWDIRA